MGIVGPDAQLSGSHSSLCLSPCVINPWGPGTAQRRSRRDTVIIGAGCQSSARSLGPGTPGVTPGSASRSTSDLVSHGSLSLGVQQAQGDTVPPGFSVLFLGDAAPGKVLMAPEPPGPAADSAWCGGCAPPNCLLSLSPSAPTAWTDGGSLGG